MCQSIGKNRGRFMDKKTNRAGNEPSRQGINQFIIECMFSKYFEEEKTSVKQEEIASPR
jgi:hypothetical protein